MTKNYQHSQHDWIIGQEERDTIFFLFMAQKALSTLLTAKGVSTTEIETSLKGYLNSQMDSVPEKKLTQFINDNVANLFETAQREIHSKVHLEQKKHSSLNLDDLPDDIRIAIQSYFGDSDIYVVELGSIPPDKSDRN